MTTATTVTQLDKDNPWPGLQSFEENAHSFFFGRDHEIELLCDRVLDAPVTVLYGRSGLGKTSLLQAGLFPSLREHNFLPVHVRFDLKPDALELTRQLQQSVRDAIRAEVPDAVLPSDEESLWEYLHRTSFELWSAQNYPLTPVIVLDQFEELFTLGKQVPDLVDDFRDELGDLAENRIPAGLCACIDKDAAVAGRFNLRSRKYRLLISLREDFLPDLEAWWRLIPALGRSRVRLLPLRVNEAVDAVYKPAEHLMTQKLALRVVRTIAGQELRRGRDTVSPDAGHPGKELGKAEVEPALLSLFCRELNEERKRSGQDRFDERLLEDAERDVLSNFYESCVRDLRPQVAVFVEEELITESGFRDNYVRQDAVPKHLTEEELDQLIRSRLLRLEDRYGAQRIELTHDVLTRVVREHRDRRLAEEEKAALAEAAELKREADARAAEEWAAELDRKRLDERERRLVAERAGRQFKWISAVLALVCTVAMVLVAVAFHFKNEADARAREAAAVGLYGDSLQMLAGMSPSGSDDVAVMQKVLAAHAIPSTQQSRKYELLTVLNEERDLLRILDIEAGVTSVAFSPDGTQIAIASADNQVQLWNTNGQAIGSPVRHDAVVLSVAFSPDGTRLATASADNTVRLWDTRTQRQVGDPLRHPGYVMSVVFSPDGTRLATASADNVQLWDTDTHQPIGQSMRHQDWVNGLAFSPDGTRLATASADNVQLWDTDTHQPIGQSMRHQDWVNGLAFSPDGTRLATASADNTVRLWDTRTQQQVRELRHPGVVMSVAFSPDGTRIAAGGYDRTIRLWDSATGQEVGVLRGHEAPVRALAFGPDSRQLVSAGGDHTVRVWDARSWQPLLGHKGAAWAGFFNDGQRIGSGGEDKTVRWWDATTGRPIGEPVHIEDSDVEFLFPLDQDRLLSLGSDNAVRLWDAHTRKPIGKPLRIQGVSSRGVVTDDTPNPRIAAQLEPGVVQVYKSDTMLPVGKQIRPAQNVWMMNFSPDGRILATGSIAGQVELWDSDTGAPLGRPMKGDGSVTSIAFNGDGHLLAVGHSDYTLQLWDTATSQPVGETMYLDSVSTSATFSPNGRTVASGGDDGTIQLFDVGDHQSPLTAPLGGNGPSVDSLYYSPDGTKVLSASEDGALRLWPAPPSSPDAARDALCAKLTHNMSEEQWNRWVSRKIDYEDGCPGLPRSDYSG